MSERKSLALVFAISAVLCATAIATQTYRVQALKADVAELTEALLVFTIERHILSVNRRLSINTSRRITLSGLECARAYGLDPMLLFATMHQESTFDPQAIGPAGERGLMQLTRDTATEIGLPWRDAFDVSANTCAGAAYLAQHISARGIERGLLRYNGGGAPGYPAMVMARYQPLPAMPTK